MKTYSYRANFLQKVISNCSFTMKTRAVSFHAIAFMLAIICNKLHALKTMNCNSKPLKHATLNDAVGPSLYEKLTRPKPVGVPRKRMELPFAVLLMRSSYAITDELDFTPMDEFQRSFFLFRQSEWEIYRNDHPYVLQGDLADPVYFDFISFAQYVVISEAMKNGKYEFVEKVGADGNSTIVRRDPALISNNDLPLIHSQRVGDAILK